MKTFKKTSKYKGVRNIDVEGEGRIQYDFEKHVEAWKDTDESDDNGFVDPIFLADFSDENDPGYEVYPLKLIPKKEYHRLEVQDAMQAEILKYKDFKAFVEVDDEGQNNIPVKWVVTEQKQDGKNQPYKARLCIRGDLEKGKENLRADSPTASKETLKLALTIAVNEEFSVKSADIKSAYLQGKRLERKIYVKPPLEDQVEGKLWLLLQGAYGILDGGRLFYLQMAETLQELG